MKKQIFSNRAAMRNCLMTFLYYKLLWLLRTIIVIVPLKRNWIIELFVKNGNGNKSNYVEYPNRVLLFVNLGF